jgi:hypothetical protein
VLLGCIQKHSTNALSARAGSDIDLVDVDQLVCELPCRLRAADNFAHEVVDRFSLIEGEEGEIVGLPSKSFAFVSVIVYGPGRLKRQG